MSLVPLSPPPTEVATALNEFRSWGAVVEHFLFAVPHLVDVHAHQLAAIAGLKIAIEEGKQRAPLWQCGPTDVSKLAPARATLLNPAQFFGTQFHFELRKPLLTFSGSAYLHPYDDAEGAPLRRREIVRAQPLAPYRDDETGGYAHAVLNPPYGLHHRIARHRNEREMAPLELGTAFLRLCDTLFGDLDTLEIYSWPTDCSAYFEPGYEWWGSNFWTVCAPSKNWIITILASSTD